MGVSGGFQLLVSWDAFHVGRAQLVNNQERSIVNPLL